MLPSLLQPFGSPASDILSSGVWNLLRHHHMGCTHAIFVFLTTQRHAPVSEDKKDDGDVKTLSEWHKLELDADDKESSLLASSLAGLGLGALGALDISFATRKTEDGKIRVRLHTSSGTSVSPSSP